MNTELHDKLFTKIIDQDAEILALTEISENQARQIELLNKQVAYLGSEHERSEIISGQHESMPF